MLNTVHVKETIITPVLSQLPFDITCEEKRAATNLLLGTALAESSLFHLRQEPVGPARGIYQIEPATHGDIWVNYLRYRKDLRKTVENFLPPDATTEEKHDHLIGNLFYATAIARIVYFRVPEVLPEAGDIEKLALYWKTYYNTHLGRGTVEHFKQAAEPYLSKH